MFRIPKPVLPTLIAVASAATPAQFSGDTFEILENTFVSGGASAGGDFSLTGTTGQSDASPFNPTGGAFSLSGGFWETFDNLIFKDGFEDSG
jgi:hypothetical protein